jgi:ketosteroid isomerase-like protein
MLDRGKSSETAHRAERFFRAVQAGAIDDVIAAYAPDALLDSPIIGRVEGQEIGRLWQAVITRTKTYALDFTIGNVDGCRAFVAWSTDHVFFDTGRRIRMEGSSALVFERGWIRFHHDMFNRHTWSAQALGFSGRILSYLPGSRAFFRDELRNALGLDQGQA